MTRLAICAYDKPEAAGGPMVWLARLLPALRERGIEPHVLLLTWDQPESGWLFRFLSENGSSVRSVRFRNSEANLRLIAEWLADVQPAVALINHVTPAWFAARWIQEAGIPCVGVLHSDDAFYRGLVDEFVRRPWAGRVREVVAVSELLAALVKEAGGDGVRCRRIAYGVPVPAEPVRAERGGLRVCYVGRLAEEQKRITAVAAAMCRAAREIPGLTGVLYGDGPQRAEVEALLAGQGEKTAVRLGGCLRPDEVVTHLAECDVLLLLSDYEGLPIAVLEAMACGVVPVCLAMRSGIPELVEDGVTGLVVHDRGDGVVAALRRLADDRALLERLSRAARARIIERYSVEAMADAWAAALRETAAGAKPREVRLPRELDLPPVHPDLACEDWRMPSEARTPGVGQRLVRRVRRLFAGRAG